MEEEPPPPPPEEEVSQKRGGEGGESLGENPEEFLPSDDPMRDLRIEMLHKSLELEASKEKVEEGEVGKEPEEPFPDAQEEPFPDAQSHIPIVQSRRLSYSVVKPRGEGGAGAVSSSQRNLSNHNTGTGSNFIGFDREKRHKFEPKEGEKKYSLSMPVSGVNTPTTGGEQLGGARKEFKRAPRCRDWKRQKALMRRNTDNVVSSGGGTYGDKTGDKENRDRERDRDRRRNHNHSSAQSLFPLVGEMSTAASLQGGVHWIFAAGGKP